MKTNKLLSVLALVITLVVWGSVLVSAQEDPSSSTSEYSSVEERRLLLSLQQERQKLRKKDEALQKREIELKTLEVEVEKKLDDLKRLREQVEGLLGKKSEVEAQQVTELSKIYEKMDPAKAALVIAELDEGLAVQILSGMKRKSAGKILNSIRKDKAISLSEGFSDLR